MDPARKTPCHDCEFRPECRAYEVLGKLIYLKPGFAKPEATVQSLAPEKARRVLVLLDECVETWLATVAQGDLDDDLRSLSLPALFDVLMSGLYAAMLYDHRSDRLLREAFVHESAEGAWAYYPYIWMCPGCVTEGVAPRDAYLPGAVLKSDSRMYAVKERLARPEGRMIGDFGALCIRAIVTALVQEDAHFAAGGGHRGEFDLIISTDSLLVLGETKASPLVSFPIAARLPSGVRSHEWVDPRPVATEWAFFVGAADRGERYMQIDKPSGSDWPLRSLRRIVSEPEAVAAILRAWKRHFDGYRLFNSEDPATRWHRFGCGNIETGRRGPGEARQLRVDNTKILPGIDRTDDIKKGIAQVMLFGRLKRGCRIGAVKTVLFGNLYAETHHEHYVKPVATLQLLWPGHEPVWLFDGIVALSRNILNAPELEELLRLPSEPYPVDDLTPEALIASAEDLAGD